jgi:hypothetical protein
MPDLISTYLTLKGVSQQIVQKCSDRELELLRLRIEREPRKVGREAQEAYERSTAREMNINTGLGSDFGLPSPAESASAQRAQRAAEEELAERLAARARSSAYYADGGLREGFRPDGTRITEEDS